MNNCIKINLKKNEIILRIDENAEHNEIIDCLKEKLIELTKLYQNEQTPIFVEGKVLQNKEIEEIQNIIKKELDIEITFDSPQKLGLHNIKKTFNKPIKNSETQYYRGALRSGQKLEFEGSIVIIGDVNGGAEIIAGENIIILGALRGVAHAGAKGNKDAIISAVKLETPQIRIANVVKEMEKDETIYNRAYIYVENDEIVIE